MGTKENDLSHLRPAWLDNAVIYQIYVASFQDSNGDGIGDIKGVESRLDYIASLGVNTLWLNPVCDSPFNDGGYDVRDFYSVAERFGSHDDIVALISAAHEKGIRVLLDLVAGHTSVVHPWFQQSASAEKTPYDDWYIWTENVWDVPRDNKRYITGYGDRDGAYMQNFFWFQPALNYGFANPDATWQQPIDAPGPQAVRAEMKKIMKFWLDAGCDGFRVDMAHSLVKGKGVALKNALNDLWHEFRLWLHDEKPDAILLAEWGIPSSSIHAGFDVDFMLHIDTPAWNSLFRTREAIGVGRDVYGFPFFHISGHGNISRFWDVYEMHLDNIGDSGFISVPSGNHDTPPRLGKERSFDELKVVFAFLLTLPGIPSIYYGDEIGMAGRDDLPSKEGSYNRTCVRTPMQWTHEKRTAGFSEGEEKSLYLPLGEDASERYVDAQEKSDDSLLNCVRELIALRKKTPALSARGTLKSLYIPDGGAPLVYQRIMGDTAVTIAINPSNAAASATLPADWTCRKQILMGVMPEFQGTTITLPPVNFSIFM